MDPKRTIEYQGWTITTCKTPISGSQEIDEMHEKLGIPIPEMIFGNNYAQISHESGWNIKFNAFDALDRVDKTGKQSLKVSFSDHWNKSLSKTEHANINQVSNPYDWTYTTDYSGTMSQDDLTKFCESSEVLPMHMLQRHEKIIFYDEFTLYEDELADNGIATCTIRIRVMPSCLLLLCRFFLRLDRVIVRIHDTRIFVSFALGKVMREYKAYEEDFATVYSKTSGSDRFIRLNDPNWLSHNITLRTSKMESFTVQ